MKNPVPLDTGDRADTATRGLANLSLNFRGQSKYTVSRLKRQAKAVQSDSKWFEVHRVGGKGGERVGKETVQFTARLPEATHRKLRFFAADQNTSINEALNRCLLAAMGGLRVSVPIELTEPERPQ
jgi:predicted HicB family RNase H-like nuclease